MNVSEVEQVEQLFRRVVREELAALLGVQPFIAPAPAATPEPPECGNPFLLSDRELEQAERLLPDAERPILRTRVMAARLEQNGNLSAANKMRRRADALEKRLAS